MTDRDPGGLFDAWADRAIANHEAAFDGPAISYPEEVVRLVVRFANGDLEPRRRNVTQERALAVDILAAAVAGHDVLAQRLAADPQIATLAKISQTPTLFFEPGRERLHWRLIGPPVAGPWILLAGTMLLTKGEPEVGRCTLASCQRFFVVELGKPGKPQRKYCGEEHRLQQHALGANDRQKRSRKKRQEEETKRKARRSR